MSAGVETGKPVSNLSAGVAVMVVFEKLIQDIDFRSVIIDPAGKIVSDTFSSCVYS